MAFRVVRAFSGKQWVEREVDTVSPRLVKARYCGVNGANAIRTELFKVKR